MPFVENRIEKPHSRGGSLARRGNPLESYPSLRPPLVLFVLLTILSARPSPAAIGKANRILLDRGLLIEGMVVNGLTDPSGTAADCAQQIKLNFALPAGLTGVDMLDPHTGKVHTLTLPIVHTRRQLVLDLDGGDAVLFKFADGAPFVGITPVSARLDLQMNPEGAKVRIQGAVGSWYDVEKSTSLAGSSWTSLTHLLLFSTPSSVLDPGMVQTDQAFYRAVERP